jgi:DNA polymerase-3 subunit chi
LAHGLAGGPQDADQPVLLGQGKISNGAQGLMLLGGAEANRDEIAPLQRIWVLFDGADPDAVAQARQSWTRFTSWGLAAQYWSDESGAWVKKSERAAAPAAG